VVLEVHHRGFVDAGTLGATPDFSVMLFCASLIEKPGVDSPAFLQVLQNPLRGLFREAALARASNNNGNDGHVFNPCRSPKETKVGS
jgi:hypothetical protein